MIDFFEEIWEEITDFFEDFTELLIRQKPKQEIKKRVIFRDGTEKMVRPAYIFAERVDNLIKLIFGISIIVSASTETVLGYSSLSELVHELIISLLGRIILLIIGFSYLLISLWKMMRLRANSF